MKAIKLLFGMAAVAGALTVTSCGDDDNGGGTTPTPTPEVTTLSGSIGTRTLDANEIYTIDGFAYVADGDKLTIPAGTIIKAENGTIAQASALVVAKGGQIDARGTASNPIIFTSVEDNIQVGETVSTLDIANDAGKWGGVILLGDAPVSTKDGDTTGSIEGVPASFTFAQYGGSDSSDNSGMLEYVSIRFTGTELQPDEEIQGLTLGGVGSGTTINNIEIISSLDDGVELFGGTVNIDNILVARQQDDGIDIDQNYSGTIKNAIVLNYNSKAGNDGFEIDGPENDTNTDGKFVIQDVTVYQKGDANMARLKSGAQGTIKNAYFTGFDSGNVILIEGTDAVDNFVNEDILIYNSNFNVPLNEAFKGKYGSFKEVGNTGVDKNGFTEAEINQKNDDYNAKIQGAYVNLTGNKGNQTSAGSTGATESAFNWTFAKEKDLF